jgi:osmotically-inducible protein OsmY
MTVTSLTASDLRVRDSVIQQLAWDSDVDASGIGVAARDGVVTLTGFIDSYAGKLAAERAAKRIHGVRAVANEVQVRLRLDRTDVDLATDAARALNLRVNMPESVQAVVHSGHITLTGTVPTLFLRAVAENAVRHVKGVLGVVNRIQVKPAAPTVSSREDIVHALRRDATVGESGIDVLVAGDTVVLKGTVRSWQERESAELAAMHGPGVAHVENLIEVQGDEDGDAEPGNA